MLPPLKREQGYYYCERCIGLGQVTGGVKLFFRRNFTDWPKHVTWIPLCDDHSKKFTLFEK